MLPNSLVDAIAKGLEKRMSQEHVEVHSIRLKSITARPTKVALRSNREPVSAFYSLRPHIKSNPLRQRGRFLPVVGRARLPPHILLPAIGSRLAQIGRHDRR